VWTFVIADEWLGNALWKERSVNSQWGARLEVLCRNLPVVLDDLRTSFGSELIKRANKDLLRGLHPCFQIRKVEYESRYEI
jgi:hypothetical protein